LPSIASLFRQTVVARRLELVSGLLPGVAQEPASSGAHAALEAFAAANGWRLAS
jgi:hypothetical protein